jgi:two-component system, NarL family, sensor kinase
MKRCKSFTRILLYTFLFLLFTVYLPAIGACKHPGSDSSDSLRILDSLVNVTKISNNLLSIKYAKRALNLAYTTKSASAMALAYKLLGVAYFPGEKDSSYLFFTTALKIADEAHILDQKIPVIYNLAMIYCAAYNYKEAITLLDSTIMLAKSVNDNPGISRAYIALGTINVNIHDFESARKMFESALEVAKKDSLYQLMGVALGNLAKVEFEKDTKKSISVQREALNYLKKVKGTEEEMAYILINMGNRYTNPDSALFYYKSALNLAVNANLPTIQFGAYNNMAYSYLDKGNSAMAESCLRDHAIPVAIRDNDHDWLSSLYDTYADVCVAQKDYKKALEMQKNALKERVRDNRQKASDQLRLLAALLDLKNKELTIQNEEKELLLQRNRLQRTELWLAIALILIIVSVFFTFIMQQRNRVKLHKEQMGSARRIIEMEETEKGRTARELHDLTGQLVMGISGTIENIAFPDPEIKEQIKARVQELGASIRHISHRMNRAMIEYFSFNELITGLCHDVTKLSGMSVNLEMPEEFPDLPKELVLHFYRITQELLTNAGKYAHDSQINIKIKENDGILYLYYSDDGDGFIPDEKTTSSMGIMNIFERVKLINGHASLKSSPGKGTSWEIVFPLGQQKMIKK